MLYLYRLLRLNIGSKRQASSNRSTQSYAPCTVRYRAGRLPKTERMMSNNQAAQKFWYYWTDNLRTIPENLLFRDFFFSARLAETPPPALFRFVLSNNPKRNSGGGITLEGDQPCNPHS